VVAHHEVAAHQYDEHRSPSLDEKLMLAVTLSRAGDRRASRFSHAGMRPYVSRSKLCAPLTSGFRLPERSRRGDSNPGPHHYE
jgi:hypothetical protein